MAAFDIQNAIGLLEQGRTEEAIPMLRHLVDTAPTYVTAYVLLARAYEAEQQWRSALEVWQRAHFLMPNSPAIREGVERVNGRMTVPSWFPRPERPLVEPPLPPAGTEDEAGRLPEEETAPEDEAASSWVPLEVPAFNVHVSPEEEAAREAAAPEPEDDTFVPPEDAVDVAVVPADDAHLDEPPPAPEPPAAWYEETYEDPDRETPEAAFNEGFDETAAWPDSPAEPEPSWTEPETRQDEPKIAWTEPDPEEPQEEPEATPDEPEWAEPEWTEAEAAWPEAGQDQPKTAWLEPDEAPEEEPDEAPEEEPEEAQTLSPHFADLDRLIDELEAARIVPRPDLDAIPTPELEDDIEDMVSETLARIYASQQQYDEAARVYELLSAQQPERADEFLRKASEMRARASDR